MDRENQIKYYTNILKEGEILLLKSQDAFFKNHYTLSPLNVLTNFSGSAGEGIVEKSGKITLFVDTRYHLLAPKQAFSGVEIYKMGLGENFYDAMFKKYPKKTVLHLPSDISLEEYMKLDKHFDLRIYKIKKSLDKNGDFDRLAPIYAISEAIAGHDFFYKAQKFKKSNPKISKMLVFDLDIISYFTNLRSFQVKYSSNFKSILYFDFKKSSYTLFCSAKIKSKAPLGFEVRKLSEFKDFIKSIEDEIYINYKDITLDNFLLIKNPKQLKSSNLALVSSIKPKSVILDMLECSKRLDCAIFEFKNKIKKEMSEVELVEMFEMELLKTGACGTSFKTILALEDNSASIHYSTYDKEKTLKDENVLLLDCGGYWSCGFATDITRTFYFGKKPSPTKKKIYTAVLKAWIACFLSEEARAKDLDLLARKMLKPYEEEGFYFNHGLGHGIGTSCHQNPPLLSIHSKDTIKPFQTHSIEPGLYGKSNISGEEFGVRIENCVLWDVDYKRFSLTKFPFEELLIDYRMLDRKEINFIKKWQADFEEYIGNYKRSK